MFAMEHFWFSCSSLHSTTPLVLDLQKAFDNAHGKYYIILTQWVMSGVHTVHIVVQHLD